jgi:26S proteasome regulatory subunit N12
VFSARYVSPFSPFKSPYHHHHPSILFCLGTNEIGGKKILTTQIRSEIASSSERAYPSLPLSSTKSLLFLDSEGAVIEFAQQRGWIVRDGQIFFPAAGAEAEEPEKDFSQTVIENTLGYARQLETIV